jgi:hypothetical protein
MHGSPRSEDAYGEHRTKVISKWGESRLHQGIANDGLRVHLIRVARAVRLEEGDYSYFFGTGRLDGAG